MHRLGVLDWSSLVPGCMREKHMLWVMPAQPCAGIHTSAEGRPRSLGGRAACVRACMCVCVCVCVRACGLCGERWQMLAGQTRSSLCTAAAAARIPAGRCHGVVSVLSRCCLGLGRFCLGFVSVLSRLCAPPHPHKLPITQRVAL